MFKILCLTLVLLNFDSRAIDITFDYQYETEPETSPDLEPMTTPSPSTTTTSLVTTTAMILPIQIETNAPAQRKIDVDLFKSFNDMMKVKKVIFKCLKSIENVIRCSIYLIQYN